MKRKKRIKAKVNFLFNLWSDIVSLDVKSVVFRTKLWHHIETNHEKYDKEFNELFDTDKEGKIIPKNLDKLFQIKNDKLCHKNIL